MFLRAEGGPAHWSPGSEGRSDPGAWRVGLPRGPRQRKGVPRQKAAGPALLLDARVPPLPAHPRRGLGARGPFGPSGWRCSLCLNCEERHPVHTLKATRVLCCLRLARPFPSRSSGLPACSWRRCLANNLLSCFRIWLCEGSFMYGSDSPGHLSSWHSRE